MSKPIPENKSLQVVAFKLGEEEFALDITHVQEIVKMGEITWVPRCPPFIKGVINLRGNIIPVGSLREKFGMPKASYQKSTRIIVIEWEEIVVGFIVDAVLEARSIPISCIEPPAIVTGGRESDYCILGVAKLEDHLLVLLDIAKLLGTNKNEKTSLLPKNLLGEMNE